MRLVWLGALLRTGSDCVLEQRQSVADVLPETVEERAVNGAKEYIKNNNLKNPSLTMLMISPVQKRSARLDQAVGRVDRGENEVR